MKFLLDWINSFDDHQSTWRGDEHVFHLVIQQEENSFATAKISILNPRLNPLDCIRKRYARLGIQKDDGGDIEPIFYGCVSAVPSRIERNLITLELLSRPDNAIEQIRKLSDSLKSSSIWDELFVPENRLDDPTYLLEGISGFYHWDRVTGELSVSDINLGHKHQVIDKIASSSINIKFCSDPLDSINIRLQAEWTQKSQGIIDLSRVIAKSFSGGVVNSFTGNDFKHRFRNLSYGVKNSAYKVLNSDIEEIPIYEQGPLNLYPKYSQIFDVSNGNGDKCSVKFKRHWFNCKLLLHWKYRQKRREIANITIKNSFQRVRNSSRKTKTVNINLRNVSPASDILPWIGHSYYPENSQVLFGGYTYTCLNTHYSSNHFLSDQSFWHRGAKIPNAMSDPSLASFFLTPRGQQSIAHALTVARAHLAWSTRCIEITFRGLVKDLIQITLDMHLTLNCADLPGGSATGKVIKTMLMADGKTGKQYIEVTIACSAGNASPTPLSEPEDCTPLTNYTNPGYATEDTFKNNTKLKVLDIEVPDFTSNKNILGILAPNLLDIADLVEDVKIMGSPEDQESIMNDAKHLKSADLLKQALNQNRTQIFLKLRNINNKAILEHTIDIVTETPWGAPKGIQIIPQ